jgi:hypothetical protein
MISAKSSSYVGQADAVAGAASSASFILFNERTNLNTRSAITKKLMIAMMKLPHINSASPTVANEPAKSMPLMRMPMIRLIKPATSLTNDRSERSTGYDINGHILDGASVG